MQISDELSLDIQSLLVWSSWSHSRVVLLASGSDCSSILSPTTTEKSSAGTLLLRCAE